MQDDSEILKEILKYSTNEIPAKYEKTKEIIENIISAGGKVIVWACYIKNIELLKEYLEANGIAVRTLYGATPVVMAKHADASIPNTPEEWLDGFNTFSIYQVLPQLIELWGLNLQTDVEAKKNFARQTGK